MQRLNRFGYWVLGLTALVGLPAPAHAQSVYRVIHHFSGQAGGSTPEGLVAHQTDPADPASFVLYGKTARGGDQSYPNCDSSGGCGVVYRLAPPAAGATAWTETLLHVFHEPDGNDGEGRPLVVTPSGSLCGTRSGGDPVGSGSVFCFSRPGPSQGYYWIGSVQHKAPLVGPSGLIQDSQGDFYTAAEYSGGKSSDDGAGSIVRLTLQAGSWTPSVLFAPATRNTPYGFFPRGTPWRGRGGVLYVANGDGGTYGNNGTVYSLTPPPAGQTTWIPALLHVFGASGDGSNPNQLIGDSAGALYGTTGSGGAYNAGTVYRLTPPVPPATAWTETILHSFTGGADGRNPVAPLFRDASGVLYGTTYLGGGVKCVFASQVFDACGVVFRLTPPASGVTSWSFSVLHTFKGGVTMVPTRSPD